MDTGRACVGGEEGDASASKPSGNTHGLISDMIGFCSTLNPEWTNGQAVWYALRRADVQTNNGFSSPSVSPAAFLSSRSAFRLATTAALRRSAYSQPPGDRSESALYECSMSDWPDWRER